jgi:hypothetical protein
VVAERAGGAVAVVDRDPVLGAGSEVEHGHHARRQRGGLVAAPGLHACVRVILLLRAQTARARAAAAGEVLNLVSIF